MLFKEGQEYTTRGGYKATILKIVESEIYPFHGVLVENNKPRIACWGYCGSAIVESSNESAYDLVKETK